jgi:hypothetical protein
MLMKGLSSFADDRVAFLALEVLYLYGRFCSGYRVVYYLLDCFYKFINPRIQLLLSIKASILDSVFKEVINLFNVKHLLASLLTRSLL